MNEINLGELRSKIMDFNTYRNWLAINVDVELLVEVL